MTQESLIDAPPALDGGDGAVELWPGSARAIAWLLVLTGVGLRLARYFAHHSLWLDESMLALNLASRSLAGLLSPLDYEQGAPVGFLLAEKWIVTRFGTSEFALRLLPQVAGLVSVPLFLQVSRRVLGWRAALVALAIFAGSEPLVQYSAEVKQYSLDVAVTLCILWLALPVLARPDAGDRRWPRVLLLGLAGALAVWLSHPAAFVLGGVGLCLLGLALRAGGRKNWSAVAVVGGLWGLSFIVSYVRFTRPLAANRGLLNYWAADFAPFPPRNFPDVMWYVQTLFRSVKDVWGNPKVAPDLGHALSGLALVLVVAGAWLLWRERRWLFLVLILPLGLTLIASALHTYPFRGRLMLFNLPMLILLIAAGVECLHASGPGRGSRRASADVASPLHIPMVVLLAAFTLLVSTLQAFRSSEPQAMRQALETLAPRVRPGDVVYLYPGFNPPFTFYTRFRPGLAGLTANVWAGHPEQWPTFESDLEGLRSALEAGHDVWVVLSVPTGIKDPGQGVLPNRLGTCGELSEIFNGPGATVFRLSGTPGQRKP